jgi:hypothetical protein
VAIGALGSRCSETGECARSGDPRLRCVDNVCRCRDDADVDRDSGRCNDHDDKFRSVATTVLHTERTYMHRYCFFAVMPLSVSDAN